MGREGHHGVKYRATFVRAFSVVIEADSIQQAERQAKLQESGARLHSIYPASYVEPPDEPEPRGPRDSKPRGGPPRGPTPGTPTVKREILVDQVAKAA